MRKIHYIAIASIFVLCTLVSFNQFVSAQGEQPELQINSTQAITVVLIGVGAGLLVAYQGARTTPEDFDSLKFFDGVIYAVIGSVPLAIGTAMTTNLDIFGYVTVFFAAIGVGSQLKKSRQKTIPNNATDDEIEAILKGG